jgi:endonuclease YncB( thermonuclease family)
MKKILPLILLFDLATLAWAGHDLREAIDQAKARAKEKSLEIYKAMERAKAKARPNKPAQPAEFQATVLQIADGATLVVQTAGDKNLNVRLYGIDAPKSTQEGGEAAAGALRTLQGRQVMIREMGLDRYSRTVALVGFQGQSVNLRQVALGHAWYYARYCQAEPICGEIKKAEARAREVQRGLWAVKPLSPWFWSKGK